MSENEQSSAELAEVLAAITVEGEAPPTYEVTIKGDGSAFKETGIGAVRQQHALDAAGDPDGSVVYGYEDIRMFVTTKAVTVPGGTFVLLVFGGEERSVRAIEAAYRLYGDPSEIDRLATDPTAAFQAFLERFAIPYESRGRRVRFIPIHTFQMPASGDLDLLDALGIRIGQGGPSLSLQMSMKVSEDGVITLAWPFVVNRSEYERHLRQHRR